MNRLIKGLACAALALALVFTFGLTGDAPVKAGGGADPGSKVAAKELLKGEHKRPDLPVLGELAKKKKAVAAEFPTSAGSVSIDSASSDQYISKSGTYPSATYSKNVIINTGVTFTVASGAKITVNGDLCIGGTLKMGSGSLTVNGDLIVFGRMEATGGTITVNKAPSGSEPGGSVILMPYTGTGAMVLSGSTALTVNSPDTDCGFLNYLGLLQMTSGSPRVTVKKGIFYAGGVSSAGKLTAGKLELSGDFYQEGSSYDDEYGEEYGSDASFAPGPAFQVVLAPGSTKKMVYFTSPWESYFDNVTVSSGVSFDGDASFISLKKNLTANFSINTGSSILAVQGNLNGKTLTTTSSVVEVHSDADMTVGSGKWIVNGTFGLDDAAPLIMSNAAGSVVVNGDFVTLSECSNLSLGTLEVNGDFYQCINNYELGATYTPGQGFVTRIKGKGRQVEFEDADRSYFTILDVPAGSSIDDASYVPIHLNLTKDTSWSYKNVVYSGNLNGHKLTVAGDMYVQDSGQLILNHGKLTVNGSLDSVYPLKMNYADESVTVNGDYATLAFGSVTNGELILRSSVIDIIGNGLNATGSHKTVFLGSAPQQLSYYKTPHFATVVTVNDTVTLPSGCYDKLIRTGTTLSALSASAGTFRPAFNAAQSSYLLLLPKNATGATLTATKKYADSVMTIDGAAVTSKAVNVPYNGSATVQIKVNAAKASGSSEYYATRTYTVKVERLNADLKSFGLPAGVVLDPAFVAATPAYTAHVPATMPSVAVKPVTDHPDSKFTIDGAAVASKTYSVPAGGTAASSVVVTGQDGVTKTTYGLTLKRHIPVSGISVSAGTLAFNPQTASYTVTLLPTTASVNLTVAKSADCSKLLINDAERTVLTLTPAMGGSATATVKATDASGKSVTTYTVKVVRPALLSGISLSTGALSPSFNAGTLTYNVYLPNTTTSVKVTPAKTADCKKMTINGSSTATNVTLSPASGGKATATIACYANASGSPTLSYVVNVYRISPVTAIKPSTGTLSPAFALGTKSYTVSVPATVSSVTLSATKAASCVSMTVNGANTSSVALKPAIGGSATATISAKAVNGATYTYTVKVNRATLVTSIKSGSSSYPLSPSFNPLTANYTISIPATATSATVTAAKAGSGVKSLTMNGASTTTATVKPPVGGSATVTVVATATDGKTKSTYAVTVKRAALVTGIGVTGGTLSPAFVPTKMSYTVSIPADATSVTVTPKKATSGVKSMTINGKAVTSVTLTPAVGGSATATIVATASDGKTKSTYTVTVKRAAILSGLSVSGGSLSPAFLATTKSYAINVPATTASVKITPVKTAACTDLKINGVAQSSITLTPAIGGSATATIVGRTAKGTSVTYTVKVNRATLVTSIKSGSSSYPLSPSFNPLTANYTISIPATATSATVTAAKAGSGVKSLTMNGASTTSATVKPPVGGSATVTVVATATDGKTKSTYVVTVKRAALVTGITVAGGTLSPAYSATVASYTVNIPATTASVTLTPVKTSAVKTLTINGKAATSVTLAPAVGGSATASIVAMATDGKTTSTYTVKVNRLAPLTGIAVTGSTLSPAFSVTRTAYTVNLPATTASVTLTPSMAAGSTVTIDGTAASSILVSPVAGASKAVIIAATASDGKTRIVYTVTVARAAAPLTGIAVVGGTLTPTFEPATMNYTVTLDEGGTSVMVTPTVAAGVTLSINGDSGLTEITLDGATPTAVIAVSAGAGQPQYEYTVTLAG